MTAAVRAQHTKSQPPTIQFPRAHVREASDKVAPEREPAQSQRETSPESAGHRAVSILRVTAPGQRVALAAGPGAPRPRDALAGDLFRDLGDRFVVA